MYRKVSFGSSNAEKCKKTSTLSHRKGRHVVVLLPYCCVVAMLLLCCCVVAMLLCSCKVVVLLLLLWILTRRALLHVVVHRLQEEALQLGHRAPVRQPVSV